MPMNSRENREFFTTVRDLNTSGNERAKTQRKRGRMRVGKKQNKSKATTKGKKRASRKRKADK